MVKTNEQTNERTNERTNQRTNVLPQSTPSLTFHPLHWFMPAAPRNAHVSPPKFGWFAATWDASGWDSCRATGRTSRRRCCDREQNLTSCGLRTLPYSTPNGAGTSVRRRRRWQPLWQMLRLRLQLKKRKDSSRHSEIYEISVLFSFYLILCLCLRLCVCVPFVLIMIFVLHFLFLCQFPFC